MKILKKALKLSLIILLSIISFIIVVIGSLNLLKFAIYSDYYSIKENVCKNPGLSDGFVCQGICAYEAQDKILVSGYMKDGSASRIYVTDLDNNSYYVTLKSPNGDDYAGHLGGIAVNNNVVYISCSDKIHLIDLNNILNAKNNDAIAIAEQIPVNNQASFIYADQNYLYVGEFHNGNQYITEHPYQTPNGTNYAIISRYSYGDLYKPNKIYSIINKVQGFCLTEDGKLIFSTSYGIKDSIYYVYNDDEAVDSGLTLDGAPVYFLGECKNIVKGPAMAEGLDYYNGKIITLTESASNKYLFGKLFFANKIIALDFNKD